MTNSLRDIWRKRGRLLGYAFVSEARDQGGNEDSHTGAPDGYLKLLEPLPVGVTTTTRVSNNTALVHVFSSRKAELAKVLRAYRAKLKPTVPVCVS